MTDLKKARWRVAAAPCWDPSFVLAPAYSLDVAGDAVLVDVPRLEDDVVRVDTEGVVA